MQCLDSNLVPRSLAGHVFGNTFDTSLAITTQTDVCGTTNIVYPLLSHLFKSWGGGGVQAKD
jgi:hypothetical protein